MFASKVAKPQTKAAATNKLAPGRSVFATRPFGDGAIEQAHMLQRSIGNQATLRFLSQRRSGLTGKEAGGAHEQEADPANLPAQAAKPGLSWDFSKIPIFPPERPNQTQSCAIPDRAAEPALVGGVTPRFAWDADCTPALDRERSPHLTRSRPHASAEPIQNTTFEAYDEPLAVFDADGNEVSELPAQGTEDPQQTVTQNSDTGSGSGTVTGTAGNSAPSAVPDVSVPSVAPPAPAAPAPSVAPTAPATPAPSATPPLVVMGPREMWFFGGETPPSYTVSAQLSTNAAGGTFSWSTSGPLRLSSASAAKPTVTTTAGSASLKDAKVFVRHTDTSGVSATVGYSLTVRSPSSMTPTGNTNNTIPRGWQTLVGYSIQDQFGTTLPRTVPINEQWDNNPAIPDFAGTNWPTFPPSTPSGEGEAPVNPAGWSDNMNIADGVPSVRIPPSIAPGGGGPLVMHFAGHWHVGRLTPHGGGKLVRNVTWRFFQNHGDHA